MGPSSCPQGRNARMEVVCVIDLHFPHSLSDRKKAFEEVREEKSDDASYFFTFGTKCNAGSIRAIRSRSNLTH